MVTQIMKTPTLGYEEDTIISKLDIAALQLVEAIDLFVSKKFLCAITLAGAAEEIFGKLLDSKNQDSTIEESYKNIEELRKETDLNVMHGLPRNKIFNHWNNARNTIKHHNKKESEDITINLFDEAYWMIKRALSNAKKLGENISNETEFENWCITQIHL